MTDIQMLIAAVGSLAAAVVYQYRATEKRLKDCEDDRQQLWRRVERIWGRVCGIDDDAEAASAGPPAGG